ncbi:HAMP domain-containing methyl-accepting chemotaxis protein [Arcobacter sp. YIC-464]|uniref:HAMP domain-containing methyl-accepting chemotaxis protein n=1 Tax=Arcobacter sp. YIC-464 TaxID=3376631 RepID=UPI003C1F826C
MLKDMKISQKLYTGFGLMIFILIVVTIIGINRVNFIDDTLEEIVEVNSVKQRYAINFRGSVHDRAIAIRDIVLSKGKEDELFKKSLENIRTLEKFYVESAKPMQDIFSNKNSVDEKEIEIFNKINEFEAKTLPLIEKIISYKQNEEHQKAQEVLINETSFLITQWLGTINEFIDYEEKKNLVATPLARDAANGFAKMIITVLIIALIIGILIAYFISKQLSQSASKIQNGLKSFFDFVNKETKTTTQIDLNSNDEFGQMANMLNDNIQKTKKNLLEDEEFVKDVTRVINELSSGNMLVKFEKDTNTHSLKELKELIEHLQDYLEHTIARDLNQLIKVLETFKNKDFTQRFPDPYATVAVIVNGLGDEISNLLKQSLDIGRLVEKSSDELISNVNILNESTNNAALSLEETSASLEQITSSVISNSRNVTLMTQYSNNLIDSANKGQDLAKSTSNAMEEINTQVTDINEAILVIDNIAFQTNILSLNAAVEAATAGEAGKGFAVVAQEVRNLANRSAEAAAEIKRIVEAATNKAIEGKNISSQMIEGYDHLLNDISKTTETINEISISSKEQEKGIAQINDSISKLDKQTQQNAQIASKTHEVANQTGKIAKQIVTDVLEKEFIGKNS